MTPAKKKYGVQIQIRLPNDLIEKVGVEADRMLISKAAVIRLIVAEYFREKQVNQRPDDGS